MSDFISKEYLLKIIEEIKDNPNIPKNYVTFSEVIRQIRDLPTFPPIDGNLIDRESLLNKWYAMSPRGRTEFDQVIMTEPTVFKVDKVIDRLKCIPFDYRKRNNDESPYADGLEEGAYKSIERAIDAIEKGGLNEY